MPCVSMEVKGNLQELALSYLMDLTQPVRSDG